MRADLTWVAGALMVMGAGAFWSTGGILMRLVVDASPWQILFYRSLALGAFFVVLLAFSGALPRLLKGGRPLLYAGCGVSLAFVGFVFSVTHTTVANTFFLLATQPLFTSMLAWAWLGERPDSRTWGAMALAICGVALMVIDGIDRGTLFGNVMALVSAIGFSLLTVTLRANRASDMRPGIVVGAVMTAVLSAIALLATAGPPDTALSLSRAVAADAFAISWRDALVCLTSGTVQIGCGMWLYTLGTRRITASEAALFALTEVLLAPVWVWWLINERPNAYTLAGGALLLAAIAFRSLSSRSAVAAPA